MNRFRAWSLSLWVWGALGFDAARAQPSASEFNLAQSGEQARDGSSERRVELAWTAPLGCPTEIDVKREIQRLLAQSSDHQTIAVRMQVARDRDGVYALTVELRAPVEGSRALEHRDCGAVTRAAALVIALSIDADAVAILDEQPSAVADAEPAPPVESKPLEVPVVPTPKPAVEIQADDAVSEPADPLETGLLPHVSLGAHVEATFAPRAAWGPIVAAGIANQWFLAELLLAGVPNYVVTVSDSDVGATFEFLMAEANVCAGMLRRVVNIAVCVTGREYWIRATGRGVDEVLKPTTAVFAMAAGPLVAIELGSWRLFGVLTGVAPLARPSFVVDNLEGELFRPPKIGLSGRLGLSLTL